jgi:threonine dehydrogenase-like Zn-dependent dehydrogenase
MLSLAVGRSVDRKPAIMTGRGGIMKAVVCRDGELEVTDVPDLRPGPGQILLNVSRAGICGSDVHMRTQLDQMTADLAAAYRSEDRAQRGVVFGHEFSGEIVEYGSDTQRRWKSGTTVVAMPMRRTGQPEVLGVTEQAPGGYAEQIVVQESVTFPVPNGLPAEHAALTEPLSVAWHAVRRSRIRKKETAFVIGCGPIGLGVITMLKAAGVGTVVASDLSPRRRDLAARSGADAVIDPLTGDPFASTPAPKRKTKIPDVLNPPSFPWTSHPDMLNVGFNAMEKLRRYSKVPWWYVFRAVHSLNKGSSGPVIFECVGLPGMIDRLMEDAPMMSRLVVVGMCIEPDSFRPVLGILKQIDVRFTTSYNPGEFRDTLHMMAGGAVDPAPLITGTVGLPGVAAAFTALENPEHHAKILIDPRSSASRP